ncbi:nitrogenase MoFe cofactor biosynthesis protein NifE [Hydrogenobacter thermophilus TK-6]|uniref:Nitrogenase iron-molybdenum cofactor biosynthesis protein NifE n=1 Tax=Hydrogenobacter thermophilus (strain DSM 6534 / IAM 12695 / TK-6) TaxID=608538 RepID=D3DIE4_HYDTT|nr:nitrogenase iron-molybdenum cofactor biosynthesis protein NifE [Hydrogenobacter thermophilus]ADO45522.1 nitrogenase MoFe cofactor biosynthesis protein NifE [Hydrogenobacter thermophilus TK-6]BAI69596.1 nitrogenase iron-molybdenum cofactor biosynthesis protein [Hydrogenobacter thermophilus TK-6]
MRNLEDFFLEPGCSHNGEKTEKERKKGCSKPQPGSASGGCAFDGAQITLLPIADAVHIVHGPIACAGNSWDNRGTRSSSSDYYRMGFTTDLNEINVIYGGEEKLLDAIKEAADKYKPPAVFVYQTCVPAMIGDDIVSVCKRASEELGLPVIPVDSPGFAGSKNLGNKLAGDALFRYVIGTREPKYTTPYDINLLGEYNIAGELWQIMPLFQELGIRVLACISGDAKYEDVAAAHRAKVNMVVCSKALLSLARKMEEKYGIPYFEGSFYGIKNTSEALRNFAKLLGSEELIEKTEKLIAKKEEETRQKLKPYIEKLKGKKVLINTGGVKSWSMVSQVQELGMVVVGTSSKKSTKEDKERMFKLLGDDGKLIDDPNPKELVKLCREHKVDVLMAGGRSKFVAIKEGIPFLDTNQERIKPYAGYDGMIVLAQELVRTIYSPVFDLYKEPPPWQY